MKKIDLSLFSTESLESLKNEIKEELFRRKRLHLKKINTRVFNFSKSKNPDDLSKALESIFKFNSSDLLRIPTLTIHDPSTLILYLSSLLSQNWSELYPRNTDFGEYYVYAHVDPRSKKFLATEECGGNYGGQPFYIGKGMENRAFDLKRNEGHGKIIREILKDGYKPNEIVKILFSGLSEQKALEMEAKLIYFFGTKYSKHRKGWLINLSEPIIPKFIGDMKIISPPTVFREERLNRHSLS